MDYQVAPYGHHGVARGYPVAQLRAAPQQLGIFHHEPLGQQLVFVLGVAQVVHQHHGFVVAQHEIDTASCRLGLLLELIHEPHYLYGVLAAVHYVAYHHKAVAAVGPAIVGVDHAVALQQADDTVEVAVRIGHDEQLLGLHALPRLALDGVEGDGKAVAAVVRRYAERVVVGQ